jgi:tRNA-dihydrouridine synthase A
VVTSPSRAGAPAISVAPMMDWTDRHCRYFHRLLTRHARLYTEMVPSGAILHGDVARHLQFDPTEHPVAVQVGGSEPLEMARCAEIAAARGYDEININVGCPSDRVQHGRFGACLMAEPERVAACVRAMRDAADIPVTVKSRIGIDERDEYADLEAFARAVSAAGCETLIVHARKAWLTGLSPKEKRDVPPLRYDVVHRLKREHPEIVVVVNGGIRTLDEASSRLAPPHDTPLDGVMIGRAAYETPYLLSEVDRKFFGVSTEPPSRREVLEGVIAYAERETARGVALKHITRHVLGLFTGFRGARAWRRHLSTEAVAPGAGVEVIREAARFVHDDAPAALDGTDGTPPGLERRCRNGGNGPNGHVAL